MRTRLSFVEISELYFLHMTSALCRTAAVEFRVGDGTETRLVERDFERNSGRNIGA